MSPKQEDLLQVAEDRLEALGPLGRRARQLTLDLAGCGVGHHRAVGQCRPVIGDPVDQPVAEGTELVRGHRILGSLRPEALQAGDGPVRARPSKTSNASARCRCWVSLDSRRTLPTWWPCSAETTPAESPSRPSGPTSG